MSFLFSAFSCFFFPLFIFLLSRSCHFASTTLLDKYLLTLCWWIRTAKRKLVSLNARPLFGIRIDGNELRLSFTNSSFAILIASRTYISFQQTRMSRAVPPRGLVRKESGTLTEGNKSKEAWDNKWSYWSYEMITTYIARSNQTNRNRTRKCDFGWIGIIGFEGQKQGLVRNLFSPRKSLSDFSELSKPTKTALNLPTEVLYVHTWFSKVPCLHDPHVSW
jgi:hypothetical protein